MDAEAPPVIYLIEDVQRLPGVGIVAEPVAFGSWLYCSIHAASLQGFGGSCWQVVQITKARQEMNPTGLQKPLRE